MTPPLLRCLALAFACLASRALAQDAAPTEPGQVTDAQIAMVQGNIEIGCVKRGLQRGAPEPAVRAFCACIAGVVREQLTKEEWQQFVVFAFKDERGAVEAIFRKHQDAMLACKKN